MADNPAIERREATPYVGIQREVTMAEVGAVLTPLTSQVFDWLGSRGLSPAGPPFWKYDVIDMASTLVVEVGVPLTAPVDGDDVVRAGILPAGRYATVLHTGHPAGLIDTTRELLDWATEQDLRWDVVGAQDGEHWGARLEEYLTNPADEPDLDQWRTRLAFRLA